MLHLLGKFKTFNSNGSTQKLAIYGLALLDLMPIKSNKTGELIYGLLLEMKPIVHIDSQENQASLWPKGLRMVIMKYV